MLFSWLATRTSEGYKKSIARVAVGSLLCVSVFFLLTATIRELESVRTFDRQMVDLKHRAAISDSSLRQRLGGLSLETILIAENLVSVEARKSAKARLVQFRALIAERATMRKKWSSELQQIIAAMPIEEARNSARAGVDAHHEESAHWAAEMDQAQLQLADAYEAIVDWCERQGANLVTQDHQFKLSTSVQEAELETLLATLRKAEERENETVSRMQIVQGRAERG